MRQKEEVASNVIAPENVTKAEAKSNVTPPANATKTEIVSNVTAPAKDTKADAEAKVTVPIRAAPVPSVPTSVVNASGSTSTWSHIKRSRFTSTRTKCWT